MLIKQPAKATDAWEIYSPGVDTPRFSGTRYACRLYLLGRLHQQTDEIQWRSQLGLLLAQLEDSLLDNQIGTILQTEILGIGVAYTQSRIGLILTTVTHLRTIYRDDFTDTQLAILAEIAAWAKSQGI
jgi:hypothetical protein